jgi:formate/nitrite transporter FocA (FNT family)
VEPAAVAGGPELGADDLAEAGSESPNLDQRERKQAEKSTPLGPVVIHEIVREQGEIELKRSFSGLAWSGLAAGLSIGFSFVAQAYLHAALPDESWRPAIAAFGYSVGFLIVVLGRQQLFTETTLTALIPTLTRRDIPTLMKTLRVWAVVLVMNLVGTFVFAVVSAQHGVFSPEAVAAMDELSGHAMKLTFWQVVVRGCSAGWLIGLMVWLLPAAGSARPMIIIILTYVIGLCQFPHIIAGSVEAAYAVAAGHAGVGDYLVRFFVPTLLGNVFGGTVLAALLNHAPVAGEVVGA